MILSSVFLKDFRSHLNTSINFNSGLNYIVGGNGQGKTSILESIYYLCTTKSNISRSDAEVIRFDQNNFEIRGVFKDLTEDKVRMIYSISENKKLYYLNDKLVNRSAEVIGKFPVVILTPADHAITQGSPADRRKLIDSIISQASSNYLFFLLDYNKTLRQRASLLNRMKEYKNQADYKELDSWTEKLIEAGSEIIKYRKDFIEEYNQYLKESYFEIMNNEEQPGIKYSYLNNNDSLYSIKVKFERLIKERRDDELRRGANLVGPHRDDFVFEINDFNLKTFGSQGQNKTFQTALRFAEFFYLKDVVNKTPIFLLDDVFGELDTFRSVKISEYLKKIGQAFITLTDFANFSFLVKDETDTLIKIKDRQITYA
jgi:DNA replication and repair protein RecF